MTKLRIDNKEITVPEGTSVLKAAEQIGVKIPSMCFKDCHNNHPSCMVCLVKNKSSNSLQPSCALPVVEGMEIITEDEEVKTARKEALELLLSDHVGDCEAPCRIGCPAFMNIPLMNRLIASGNFKEALKVVKEEIALPHILGYICSAPCEKVCRRNQIDDAVSICQLKKFVAAEGVENSVSLFPAKEKNANKKVAIIGAGPAGLSSAFYLLRWGYDCTIFDKNEKAGGTLRYSKLDKELPEEVLDSEVRIIEDYGAEFRMNINVTDEFFINEIRNKFDAVIIACGNISDTDKHYFGLAANENGLIVNSDTFETGEKGIFACGCVIRPVKMVVRLVAQGKTAAWSAKQYLQGKQIEKVHKPFNSRFGKLRPEETKEYLKESVKEVKTKPKNGELKGYIIDEAIKEAKRCMHCDCRKLDDCKLRIFSDEYKVERRKYLFGERKSLVKQYQHEKIIYEPEKCIKCGLCVDITKCNDELLGFAFINRGFNVQINVPFNKSIKDALTKSAAECVESCPTGALSFKEV